MYLNTNFKLFGDDDGKELGKSNVILNLNLENEDHGRRKIAGQTRFSISVDEKGRCNNDRNDFPLLDSLNMELEWNADSDEIVKFTFASGDGYSENMRTDCEKYGQWEAIAKRATHMQMSLNTWVEDFDDYVTLEYKVVY